MRAGEEQIQILRVAVFYIYYITFRPFRSKPVKAEKLILLKSGLLTGILGDGVCIVI